jgi:4-amino-4-deoxy-L-arabinose transferase-like glycosyltransferase
MGPNSRTDSLTWRRGLTCIVVAAALVRVAIIVASPHFLLWGDPVDYQQHAVSIAAGHGYPSTEIATPGTPSAFRPPGYPYLLGALYAVAGVHPDAGRLLGALLGVLTVVLIGYLARALWSPRVGLVAAGLASVFLPLASLNVTLVSESLFVPIEVGFALSLLMCVRRPDRARWIVLAGFLCGLAVLTRVVADLWIIPMAMAIFASSPTKRAGLRRAAAAAAVVVVTLTPWAIRNLVEFHAFVPISTEGGYTMAGQYNAEAARRDVIQAVWRDPLLTPSVQARVRPLFQRPGGVDEAELDAALRHQALDYLIGHPRHLIAATWLNTIRLVDVGLAHSLVSTTSYRELGLPGALREPTTISAQLVAALALLALVVCVLRRLRYPVGPVWLWMIPALTLLVTVPFGGNPRKRVPLDPFLVLLASLVICTFLAAARERLRGRAAETEISPVAGLPPVAPPAGAPISAGG